MKITVEADKVESLFGQKAPALQTVLNNKYIKNMTKGLEVSEIKRNIMNNDLVIVLTLPGGSQ